MQGEYAVGQQGLYLRVLLDRPPPDDALFVVRAMKPDGVLGKGVGRFKDDDGDFLVLGERVDRMGPRSSRTAHSPTGRCR